MTTNYKIFSPDFYTIIRSTDMKKKTIYNLFFNGGNHFIDQIIWYHIFTRVTIPITFVLQCINRQQITFLTGKANYISEERAEKLIWE